MDRAGSVTEWHWPAWLALSIATGCLLALVRLAVAVAVSRQYRAASRASCRSFRSSKRFPRSPDRPAAGGRSSSRRATALASAATVGWLRPAIILPADWRSWNRDELRGRLAHEVAHIVRGDYAWGLVAQVGVALHFYNPLVHWLSRRLRLEQEMAADVWGARAARQPPEISDGAGCRWRCAQRPAAGLGHAARFCRPAEP